MGDQQAYGVLPVAAVPYGEPVHPDHPVEPRDSPHKQYFHHDQVRPHETSYSPGGCQPRPEALDTGGRSVVPPHVNDAQCPEGDQRRDHAFPGGLGKAERRRGGRRGQQHVPLAPAPACSWTDYRSWT